jgi:HAMP domain-containing protein
MNLTKFKRRLIKWSAALQGMSIRRKAIATFGVGFFALTVITVEFMYSAMRTAAIEQLQYLVKVTTENAYNEIKHTFDRLDRQELTEEQALEEIRNRIAGPLSEMILTANSDGDQEAQFRRLVGLIDAKILKNIELISERKSQEGPLEFHSGDGNRKRLIAIVEEGDAVRFRVKDPDIVQKLYSAYSRLSSERKSIIRSTVQIQILRDLSKSSIKLGNDGYVYALRVYNPGWLIPGTKYPDDYSIDSIMHRYETHFVGTHLTGEEVEIYLENYGRTPEENLKRIQADVSEEHRPPRELIADVHPYLEDQNLDNAESGGIRVPRNIILRRDGNYRYSWKNPADQKPRRKVVYMKTFEHRSLPAPWVIACGAYEDDVLAPVERLRLNIYIIAVSVSLILAATIIAFFRINVMDPLESLHEAITIVNTGKLDMVIRRTFKDEIGYLAKSFNRMLRNIRRSNQKLQEYAANLEKRVMERTQELQNTLAEVRELKTRQDGDYYLTSLLLKPLAANHTDSETVDIDFLVKQKKQFSFRKWQGEIGGDLCIARSIRLKEREYTFFMNADAMGKSIQGAGGALIIGSVLVSILERTVSAFIFKDYYPERWLKNTFMELRKIFESFNGAMGASIVIGLVEDSTGMIYYINAEHPAGVLYRNGRASFIETHHRLKRLGVHDPDDVIAIQTIQMRSGDQIFFGSDGKDDIRIYSTDAKAINEDETLFLKIVEKCQGDLDRIYEEINQTGEITDDLSILRILYRPPVEQTSRHRIASLLESARKSREAGDTAAMVKSYLSVLEIDPAQRRALSELINYHLKREEYDMVLKYGEAYIEANPANVEILYLLSYAYRKKHQYNRAIDLGERVYLRDPGQLRNLLNLAYCYSRAGNIARAEYFIEKVFALDPHNQMARRIVEVMSRPQQIQ